MNQKILLDTNIIQFRIKGDWKTQVQQLLIQQEKKGYTAAVSEITFYELLRSAQAKAENEIKQALEELHTYQVSREVLLLAADLYGYYKELFHGRLSGISDADIVIAATAFMTDSLLLTANITDFPTPFFREVARFRADRKKGAAMKSLYFYVCEVDTAALKSMRSGELDLFA